MIKRGWSVKAVELSPDLGRVAREKLPELEVIIAEFEHWPLPPEKFDLVLAATAFHWIDPAVRVPKSADALRPGGLLAVVSTHHIAGGSEQLWLDVQDCYRRFTTDADEEGLKPAAAIPKDSAHIDASGRFGPVRFRRYEWEQTYTTSQYLDLLSSYSGHRALTSDARDGLYGCVSALIEANGGAITKRYLTDLLHWADPLVKITEREGRSLVDFRVRPEPAAVAARDSLPAPNVSAAGRRQRLIGL
jgi:SAM-dependent methyltransferase